MAIEPTTSQRLAPTQNLLTNSRAQSAAQSTSLGQAASQTSGASNLSAANAQRRNISNLTANTPESRALEEAKLQDKEAAMMMDKNREAYQTQFAVESERQNASLEEQKNKGYEQIREQQRVIQNELARIRREGERELSHLKTYYQDAAYAAETDGKAKLKATDVEQFKILTSEQKAAANTLAMEREMALKKFQRTKEDAEEKLGKITEELHKNYLVMEENATDTQAQTTKHFQDRFETISGEQEQILHRLKTEVGQKIDQIRQQNTQKLGAYASRQQDPFYKMVDLDARFQDRGDAYVLTATIPPQEREHVTVAIKGNQLVIAGYRRSEERQPIDSGGKQSTSSYQSFQQSYPMSLAVDSKLLSHTFEGDQLKVIVPKKT